MDILISQRVEGTHTHTHTCTEEVFIFQRKTTVKELLVHLECSGKKFVLAVSDRKLTQTMLGEKKERRMYFLM